jgi:RNA polymerase sigma-70 factor (ECF subfamily)
LADILSRPPSLAGAFIRELWRDLAEALAAAGRALPEGRLAVLGATRHLPHGLLAADGQYRPVMCSPRNFPEVAVSNAANEDAGWSTQTDLAIVGAAPMAEELLVKSAQARAWDDLEGRESSLVARCAEGDEAACAELVAEHQRMVFQLAFHLLGNRDEALDLSQDVFMRVFRTLPQFRGQSQLRTWIYRIVVNQARNRQRWWRRRHRASLVSLDQHLEAHGEPTSGPEDVPDNVLAQKRLAEQLGQALDGLPFDQRTVVVLREIDGLSYDEIAYSLGVTLGTVKSRLTRARRALREVLQEVAS